MVKKRIKVLVVEDNEFTRLGIVAALNHNGTLEIAGEARNGQDAIEKYSQLKPDVVLMDVSMPIMNGIDSTRQIKQLNNSSKVIMLTSHTGDEEVFAALSAGANGYCLKDIDLHRLHEAITAVYSGDLWLDASIAGKVVKLCADAREPNGIDQAKTVQETNLTNLTDMEREIMRLLTSGRTTNEIATRLNLPVSTAKAYVVNALNKVAVLGEMNVPNQATSDNLKGDTNLNAKYELIGKVASGGMSIVYKARHRLLGRVVAIKMLNGTAWQNVEMQERFKQEAQITCKLIHPNIIAVHDFGIGMEGQPYLVMDYVDGPTLAQVLERGGRIAEKEAVRMFAQVADALDYAHVQGVVHRDIKPGNILLSCQDPKNINVKIVDFGLAQTDFTPPDQRLTQLGQVFGSPLYMSPEQCQGQTVDTRSDIYSFGCVMYEVLKGAPPFYGKSPLETMNMHVHLKPPTLSQASTHLAHLIGRCLSKDPAERFSTLQEISSQLRSIA